VSSFGAFTILSFDVYGTLIDWESGILAELRPWTDRVGIEIGDEALLETYGELETVVEAEHPAWRYPDVLAETFRRVGARLAVAVTDDEAASFGASVPRWPAFPDSADALRDLKSRFRLAVLSNVDRDSFAASNEKLGDPFDVVVTAEDVGSYKPDARNFDALFAAVGRDGLLHVAQSLFHDHAPARRLDLPSVWIDRRAGRPGSGATPHVEVSPAWRFDSLAAFAEEALA
jgi:2-haloacid dehalogenase